LSSAGNVLNLKEPNAMSKARRGRALIVLSAVALVGSLISYNAVSKRREPLPQKVVTKIPPVYSKVKTLEVVGVKVLDENTPAASVSVEIFNNSDKAVMAVDLVCGEGAITKNGLTDEENPIVVIEPYGVTTIEMTFGAMTPNTPLVISAVTYADGTEEGVEESLRAMHRLREHDRAILKKEREKARKNP
jgi:hypothetical protein